MEYEKPQVVRFGTFRELTQHGKYEMGADLTNAFGCRPYAKGAKACLDTQSSSATF